MEMVSGANVALTKEYPDSATLVASFGWKNNSKETEFGVSAILCGENKKAVNPQSMVYSNQILSDDETVELMTSDMAFASEFENGDKERIEVDIAFVPEHIHKIVFLVYVNPEERRKGSFSSMTNAYIRLDTMDGNEMVKFSIPSDTLTHDTQVTVFGELYRYNGQWKFRAIGQGYPYLINVAQDYGVDL